MSSLTMGLKVLFILAILAESQAGKCNLLAIYVFLLYYFITVKMYNFENGFNAFLIS